MKTLKHLMLKLIEVYFIYDTPPELQIKQDLEIRRNGLTESYVLVCRLRIDCSGGSRDTVATERNVPCIHSGIVYSDGSRLFLLYVRL